MSLRLAALYRACQHAAPSSRFSCTVSGVRSGRRGRRSFEPLPRQETLPFPGAWPARSRMLVSPSGVARVSRYPKPAQCSLQHGFPAQTPPGGAFATWTDSRDLVAGTDPREAPGDSDADGFDVLQTPCPSTVTAADPCLDTGGLDQNIYGSSG